MRHLDSSRELHHVVLQLLFTALWARLLPLSSSSVRRRGSDALPPLLAALQALCLHRGLGVPTGLLAAPSLLAMAALPWEEGRARRLFTATQTMLILAHVVMPLLLQVVQVHQMQLPGREAQEDIVAVMLLMFAMMLGGRWRRFKAGQEHVVLEEQKQVDQQQQQWGMVWSLLVAAGIVLGVIVVFFQIHVQYFVSMLFSLSGLGCLGIGLVGVLLQMIPLDMASLDRIDGRATLVRRLMVGLVVSYLFVLFIQLFLFQHSTHHDLIPSLVSCFLVLSGMSLMQTNPKQENGGNVLPRHSRRVVIDNKNGFFQQQWRVWCSDFDSESGENKDDELAYHRSPGEKAVSSSDWIRRRFFNMIFANPDSRKIFIFLCMNLFFMFVEIAVGVWTNSLGLISDAGHMFFDCSSLCLGLFASTIVKVKKPDGFYGYGYGRYEVLAGFVNGVFLIFVAGFVLLESVERITTPPEMRTEGLLATSIVGFLVNIIGLVFFHDHAHGGHGGEEHHHGHSHGGNQNMRGVYLHILADALGSGGVIVSSLLVEYKGWIIADPICSFCISILIFASALPLLSDTADTLMNATPKQHFEKFEHCLEKILKHPQVVQIREPHLWSFSSTILIGTVFIVVKDGTDTQAVLKLASGLFREIGVTYPTIQVSTSSGLSVLLHDKGRSMSEEQSPMIVWMPSKENGDDLESGEKTSNGHAHHHDDDDHGHSHEAPKHEDHDHEDCGHSHSGNGHDHQHSHATKKEHKPTQKKEHSHSHSQHGHSHPHAHAHAHN